MRKRSHCPVIAFRRENQDFVKTISSFALIGLVACCLSFLGCSVTKELPTQTGANPQPAEPSSKARTSRIESAADQLLQDLSVHEDRGETTLFLKFANPVTQYRHFTLVQPARVVLDILDYPKSSTATDVFRIETSAVSALRLNANEQNLRIVVDVAAAKVPPYTIAPEDGGLKIVIGVNDPGMTAKKSFTLVKGGKKTDPNTAGHACPSVGEIAPLSPPSAQENPDKKYNGSKISLEFKDADIKNIFRLIGEVSGKNILVTDDVNKKITIRLMEVPWNQALDVIIQTNGLAKEEIEEGNIIRISTAARLAKDKQDQLEARVAASTAEIPQIAYLNVNYARAKELVEKVKLVVKAGADIVPDERSNTIIVRGNTKDVQDITCIVSRLDTRTSQVLIESNLVETTPTFARSLGMELDALFNDGRVLTSSRFLAGAPFAGSAAGIPVTVPALPVPNSGFRFGYFGNNVAGLLSAAENEGLVKIISRPSVVTLNNIPSTIKSERVLRIVLPSSTNIASGSGAAAGTAVATEKINVGINLTVIPQVSSDGFVLMNIKVKSSSIANSPTVPAGTASPVVPFDELNREAEANVLVKDGETIVIGGILKDTDNNSTAGIPYLKDIPVVGWLFKNWRIQKDFEELIVFITPRLASAGSENLPSAEQLWRDQMKKTDGKPVAVMQPGNP